MSIYLFSSKIKKLLAEDRYNLPDEKINSIVATGIRGKNPHILKLEDYSEDILFSLVTRNKQEKKYKYLYVDYRFWNYKYCSLDNLQTENLHHLMDIDPRERPYIETHKFYVGLVVVTIMYYSVLYHSLLLDDKIFKNYMSMINIDKNNFSRFLISNNIYFPLTQNYLTLIQRVFTNDSIANYLFPNPFYSPEDIFTILKNFNVIDIRYYVKNIYESGIDLLEKYKYISVIFDSFEESIDENKKVFATEEMDVKPVAYYLDLMSPDDQELDNLYDQIIQRYSLLGGAKTIQVY